MKYNLLNNRGYVIGEAVKLSESLVYYHLWDSLTFTRECTFEQLIKKFKIEVKE